MYKVEQTFLYGSRWRVDVVAGERSVLNECTLWKDKLWFSGTDTELHHQS